MVSKFQEILFFIIFAGFPTISEFSSYTFEVTSEFAPITQPFLIKVPFRIFESSPIQTL